MNDTEIYSIIIKIASGYLVGIGTICLMILLFSGPGDDTPSDPAPEDPEDPDGPDERLVRDQVWQVLQRAREITAEAARHREA